MKSPDGWSSRPVARSPCAPCVVLCSGSNWILWKPRLACLRPRISVLSDWDCMPVARTDRCPSARTPTTRYELIGVPPCRECVERSARGGGWLDRGRLPGRNKLPRKVKASRQPDHAVVVRAVCELPTERHLRHEYTPVIKRTISTAIAYTRSKRTLDVFCTVRSVVSWHCRETEFCFRRSPSGPQGETCSLPIS
jgi:hypothetical protein